MVKKIVHHHINSYQSNRLSVIRSLVYTVFRLFNNLKDWSGEKRREKKKTHKTHETKTNKNIGPNTAHRPIGDNKATRSKKDKPNQKQKRKQNKNKTKKKSST